MTCYEMMKHNIWLRSESSGPMNETNRKFFIKKTEFNYWVIYKLLWIHLSIYHYNGFDQWFGWINRNDCNFNIAEIQAT